MIKCTFCSYADSQCDVCDGFGWFTPDDSKDIPVAKPVKYDLEQAISENPLEAIHLLKKWFKQAAVDLSNETGAYVFFEDVAESLEECEGLLEKLGDYEERMAGNV